jgi:acid phosphatase
MGTACGEPPRGEFEIPNLGVIKEQIKAYHDSGEYDRELQAVADKAKRYLEENLPRYQGQKNAVVFDIDETALSNWTVIKQFDFGYVRKMRLEWLQKAEAPAIPGTLELFKLAREKGLAIFFITGREESERALTIVNLNKVGYTGYSELICKPDEQPNVTVGEFKRLERKRLTEKGYRIILNIGDQMSDLAGGYSEATFKLPNPMYYVP